MFAGDMGRGLLNFGIDTSTKYNDYSFDETSTAHVAR